MLSQIIPSLDDLITNRNNLIAKFRESQDESDRRRRYFGLPDSDGHVDRTYPDLVSGIYTLTDDCIYFSMQLADGLIARGDSLRKKYGKGAPSITRTNWSSIRAEGLLPEDTLYTEWSTKFGPPAATPTAAD
jgi:hypothetical protein